MQNPYTNMLSSFEIVADGARTKDALWAGRKLTLEGGPAQIKPHDAFGQQMVRNLQVSGNIPQTRCWPGYVPSNFWSDNVPETSSFDYVLHMPWYQVTRCPFWSEVLSCQCHRAAAARCGDWRRHQTWRHSGSGSQRMVGVAQMRRTWQPSTAAISNLESGSGEVDNVTVSPGFSAF